MGGVIAGNGPLTGFGVSVRFDAADTVLAVSGEVDLVTAPELGAVLDAVAGRGHTAIVLDLAQCEFMGAAGLGVIAVHTGLLGRSGGSITIRSASAHILRLLAITGLSSVIRLDHPGPPPGHLAPEQSGHDPKARRTIDSPDLTEHLRQVTAIPADEDVVDGALRLVVALARATVGGADGVSVSLRRHGRLGTVAASDQTISDMDTEQYATGEGPCVDASAEGRWFHVESLDEESRWPAFIPKARKLGINAILSTPLSAGERAVGALNIYSNTPRAFAEGDQRLASVFASQASIILRDAGAGVTDDELSARLADALRTRQVIAEAQGVIMERRSISEQDAHTQLRHLAKRADKPLRNVAAEIVESAHRPPGPVHKTGDPRTRT